jgi:RNA polymerase sigma-70 factor (sigma-E family)
MTFEEFAATRLPALLKFAAVLAGDRATAEDLSQEVLTRVYAGWDRIGVMDRPELYARKMILNEFLSWRRRSWRLVPVADAETAGRRPSVVPDHAHQHSERDGLLAEIGKLPRRQRAVLVLRYYEDRADTEIAELLGCAPATVRAHASRGLAALRVELRPQQPSVPGPAGEGSR